MMTAAERRDRLQADVLRVVEELAWNGVIEVRLRPTKTPQILIVHREMKVEAKEIGR